MAYRSLFFMPIYVDGDACFDWVSSLEKIEVSMLLPWRMGAFYSDLKDSNRLPPKRKCEGLSSSISVMIESSCRNSYGLLFS